VAEQAAKVLLGLGNPGRKYESTRHNTGFLVLDHLAHRWKFPLFLDHDSFLLSSGKWQGMRVHMLKPLTYMNSSGLALIDYEKQRPFAVEDLLVIHDELDLPLGSIRIRAQGGSGGHKGVESLIQALQGEQFARLRIGISPPEKPADGTSFVLSRRSAEEEEIILDEMPRILDAIECFCAQGVTEAMNRYNA
jgi:PTH1 family peptidyl-tRNA hydrolase